MTLAILQIATLSIKGNWPNLLMNKGYCLQWIHGMANAREVKKEMLMKPTISKKTSKNLKKQKPMTFGELIASTYTSCGKRAARKILQAAVNAEIITLGRRHQHYMIG